MTKFYSSILFLFLGYVSGFSQAQPPANRLSEFLFKSTGQNLLSSASGSPVVLFQNTPNSSSYLTNIKDSPLKQNAGLVIQASRTQVREIILRNSSTLNLQMPINAVKDVTLRLVQTSISHRSFSVLNSRGQAVEQKSNAIHYQGIIEGDANSIVAVSFFPSTNTLMGLISDKSGNKVIGKINDNSDNYVVYAQKDLSKSDIASCFVDDKSGKAANITKSEMAEASATGSGCKTIKIYFEADNNLFVAKGGTIQATVDYITGIFNQVSTLYRNESIDMVVSQIKVWDTVDPYASMTSTSSIVSAFRNNLNGVFNGDIAHFVSGRLSTLGGGIAYTIPAGICNKIDMCCVSAIQTTYQTIPTYSWTVNVITHEMGHLLGSRHTHWCGWVGGAIDGCAGYIEADSSGNSCTVPGNPSGGGTIMSYCHNTSAGINLALIPIKYFSS
jgi:trimeric autotransporter adhesin